MHEAAMRAASEAHDAAQLKTRKVSILPPTSPSHVRVSKAPGMLYVA
jgi:hypothetical protein